MATRVAAWAWCSFIWRSSFFFSYRVLGSCVHCDGASLGGFDQGGVHFLARRLPVRAVGCAYWLEERLRCCRGGGGYAWVVAWNAKDILMFTTVGFLGLPGP